MRIRRSHLRALMPHQQRAVQYALRTRHPTLLMQMRLGKTLSAIRWAMAKGLRRCLVVAPLNVLEAWERELGFEGERFVRVYDQAGTARRNGAVMEAWKAGGRGRTWALLHYEGLLAMAPYTVKKVRGRPRRYYGLPEVAMLPWDLVLLDESTRVRNPQAHGTKLVCKGFRAAKHRVLLSGLVSPESMLDVFTQFLFLHGQFMGHTDYYRWRDRYFKQDWGGFGWVPKPGARAAIKAEVHRLAFVLRRSQAGIKDQFLPEVLRVNMGRDQGRMYREVEKSYAMALLSGERVETQWKLVQQNWLRHLAGGFEPGGESGNAGIVSDTKFRAVVDLLEGELSGENVVVWFAFRHELTYMAGLLEKAKVPLEWVWGGLPQRVRSERLNRARNRKRGVFLSTVDCAKFGGDFSFADAEIYYSNSWSCEARAQSKERLVHPMKPRPILLIDAVTKDTVDEDVLQVVSGKVFNANYFMTAMESAMMARAAA